MKFKGMENRKKLKHLVIYITYSFINIFFYQAFKNIILLLLFSCWFLSDSFVTPWTVAHQSPLSLGFPRQKYWSELPFSSPGDLPDPGIKPYASC